MAVGDVSEEEEDEEDELKGTEDRALGDTLGQNRC